MVEHNLMVQTLCLQCIPDQVAEIQISVIGVGIGRVGMIERVQVKVLSYDVGHTENEAISWIQLVEGAERQKKSDIKAIRQVVALRAGRKPSFPRMVIRPHACVSLIIIELAIGHDEILGNIAARRA